jgi:diguanylate cyclase (GGDEF)-like protein
MPLVILLFVYQSALAVATALVLLRLRLVVLQTNAKGGTLALLGAAGLTLLLLSARGLFAASRLLQADLPASGYGEWLLAATGAVTLAVVTAYGRLLIERAELRRAVNDMAATDTLTGAYNKGTFFTTAGSLVRAAQRYRHPLTALVVDIDQLRRIEREIGRTAGDESLRALGGTLGNCVRQIDILGRLDGKKFAIVLPHTDLSGANVVAERIRAAIQREINLIYQETSVRLTASVGVAALHDGNLENLLNVAEGAIYSEQTAPEMDQTLQ